MRLRPNAAAMLLLAGATASAPPAPAAEPAMPPLVVTIAAPRDITQWTAAGSGSRIEAADIARTRPTHASELFARVPGVWISRGDGQESLIAIRSPVLTGAGACGAFQILEDGIPIRPAGFCNVNQLFEVDFAQAAAVEVARGPASSQYGANALHGAINVVSPKPGLQPWTLGLEAGADDTVTGHLSTGSAHWRLDARGSDTHGFRDATPTGEQKLGIGHATTVGRWQVQSRLAASNLNQETAGYILGKDAYRDAGLRRDNLNPEAYRDAASARIHSAWRTAVDTDTALSITPYARWSRMQFLQHYLPGQPTEENGQRSAGLLLDLHHRLAGGGDWRGGLAFEYAQGFVTETQARPLTTGSAFLQATRPAGVHYDFEVSSRLAALWQSLDLPLDAAGDWRLLPSVRVEYLDYDYDNHALTGNTRDDGTPCGFGGCLHNRPADRQDRFTNVAGRLGLRYGDLARGQWHAAWSSGFRPPQATELYRLQRGQDTADLDSERLQGVEVGYRRAWADLQIGVTAFGMKKTHFIFTDAQGFNVSDGRTRHFGLETEATWRPASRHTLSLAASLARHRYAFDRAVGGGETIEHGNEIDTAPPFMATARWLYRPRRDLTLELEGIRMGPYYLNAANTARYDGHTLLNLRADWAASSRTLLFARITNLTGRDYAERADFAFGNHRYFPGQPRRLFIGIEWTP
ncbi:MAG TPA: TonB-dependent receptor [Gammaproteobacteria bacterium]|nr:TonB-dependent receptor [Gammaproteobacteria bacterium]MCH77560.1 TonB-dependent receptor [Gammaproteobacteria bacterium]